MKKIKIIGVTIVILASIALLFSFVNNSSKSESSNIHFLDSKEITVYKDPLCGCCDGHIKAYRDAGFKVNVIKSEDMSKIKDDLGVPRTSRSCHTAVIDDYYVEGHVPMEAIEVLLRDKPQIEGISLPGMPSGTPGMPGPKFSSFKVEKINNSNISLFMEI